MKKLFSSSECPTLSNRRGGAHFRQIQINTFQRPHPSGPTLAKIYLADAATRTSYLQEIGLSFLVFQSSNNTVFAPVDITKTMSVST